MQACWREMAKLRSSSVCTICSGRSEFFFRGQKSIISGDICNQIVQKCFSTFIILARASEIAGKLLVTISNFYQNNLIGLPVNKDNRKGLEHLIKIFCSKYSPFSPCNDVVKSVAIPKLENWLCSKFIRLSKKTLIQEVEPLLTNLNNILRWFFVHLTLNFALFSIRPPANATRLQPFQAQDFPFITEEVTVTHQRSNISVVESLASMKRQPMNLSLNFP